MTPIEELNLLQELIHKYNLPCSPIMEYAINEQKEKYLESNVTEEIISDEMKLTIQKIKTQEFESEDTIISDSIPKHLEITEVKSIKKSNHSTLSYHDIAQNNLEQQRMEAILYAMNNFDFPATARDIARKISRSAWGGNFIHEEFVETILKKLPEVKYVKCGKYILNYKI